MRHDANRENNKWIEILRETSVGSLGQKWEFVLEKFDYKRKFDSIELSQNTSIY
jgi:hypothetical protein